MDYIVDKKEVPMINAVNLPNKILGNNSLVMDASKNVDLTVDGKCDIDRLNDLINNIRLISEQERAAIARTGIVSIAEFQKRGIELTEYVDTSTNINIDFEDLMSSDIFDTTFTEK